MITKEQQKAIDLEDRKIAGNLSQIAHRIVVFSGKGGVGKTTVSVNLAYGLVLMGRRTGILDADVTGPNVPKMLGLNEQLVLVNNRMIPHERDGVKVISLATIIPPDQPVVWRGPLRSRLLYQFLGDVEWGPLDYLVADLPPGTGDEILTMTQKMEPDLAIIVTTPQEMSLIDSSRAVTMARQVGVPHIGIVENMSGLRCPGCGHRIDLFGSGGGEAQAKRMNVRFLGALPIDAETREMADRGRPIILEDRGAEISRAFFRIAESVEEILGRPACATVDERKDIESAVPRDD